MGLRFRKSKNFGPFRFTLSKTGISSSVGVKGFRVTKTASGRVRTTASIPGTGISYVKETGGKPKASTPEREKHMSRGRSSKSSGTGCLIWFILIMALFGACVGAGSNEKDDAPTKNTFVTQETPNPRVTRRPAAAPTETPELVLISPEPIEEVEITPEPPPLSTSEPTLVSMTVPNSEPTPELTPESTPELTPEPTPTPVPLFTYVVNTNSWKFHYPGCSSVSKMKDSNKLVLQTTRDALIAQGYSPCGQCHP